MAKKYSALATYLKESREAVGLTQREVASYLEYEAVQFVSNWERDISPPPISLIKTIANLYKISAEEMLTKVTENFIERAENNLRNEFKEVFKRQF